MSAITGIILLKMQMNGISIGALAKKSGVSSSQISRWLANKSDISISRFFAILKALNINPVFIPKELDNTELLNEQRINFH
jgi:transcriptional regulator with XRE-family HTH domain